VGIGGGRGQWLGGTMARAEHEPITGVWGRAPSGVKGQSPWSGGAKPPEAESIFGRWMSNGAGKFSPCICISTLGATVMIWEKFCRNPGGDVTPLAPSWGAHACCILCEIN